MAFPADDCAGSDRSTEERGEGATSDGGHAENGSWHVANQERSRGEPTWVVDTPHPPRGTKKYKKNMFTTHLRH